MKRIISLIVLLFFITIPSLAGDYDYYEYGYSAVSRGPELITDGTLAVVTEGVLIWEDDCAANNTANWRTTGGTVAFDIDHYEFNPSAAVQRQLYTNGAVFAALTSENTYVLASDVKDGSAANVGLKSIFQNNAITTVHMSTEFTTTTGYVTNKFYINAVGTERAVAFRVVPNINPNNVEIKNIYVKPVTFVNWIGWMPQITTGALTNKAYKAPSVSANLEQATLAAVANVEYEITYTWTKDAGDAGDGFTVEFGSTDSALSTTAGTITVTVRATDTDYLKFKQTDGNANLEATIDNVSVKRFYY